MTDIAKPTPRYSLPHVNVPSPVVTSLNALVAQLAADAAARRRQLDDGRIEAFISAVSEVYK